VVSVFHASEQGFAVVGLRTPDAELAMVPALGGRIVSLRRLPHGRQWCWHQDRPDWLWANRPGDDFGGSPQAGIDECLPSVAACAWNGRQIPDHGELWYQSWTLDPQALARGELDATVTLDVSPFRFRRVIRAEPGGFVFDYALTSTGAQPEAFLWSLHPLFPIEDGDRLELPPELSELRLNGGLGDRPIAFGDRWRYPEPFPGVRLDQLQVPGAPAGCVKGFAGPLREGRAAIRNPRTGDRLELRWDAELVPHLGLWLNRGHGGFHHVALEPTTGAPDSLADAALRWHEAPTIEPGQTLRWSVGWTVG
jgi:galactose mutarotase-like enzyme